MKKAILTALTLVSAVSMSAQVSLQDVIDDPCQSANNLRCYPESEIVPLTPAPKGYTPFYMYYIGRHGSRYLTRESQYTKPLATLEAAHEAGALTEKGEDVLRRIRVITAESKGRVGALTQVGARQLHGIAERMYMNYPQIFMGDTEVDARSTEVARVVLTMCAWCERIKELNPDLRITRESGNHDTYEWGGNTPDMQKFNSDSAPGQRADAIRAESLQPARLESVLFKKPSKYVKESGIDTQDLMYQLYFLASDAQSIDLPLDEYGLYDIFTPEELFNISRVVNYELFYKYGSSPETRAAKAPMGVPVVELLVKHADDAVAAGVPYATMRFCHDGNVGPFAAFLRIPAAVSDEVDPHALSDYYSASDVVPMATNIQFVFFHNEEGDVIVKVLFCEKEVRLPAKTDMYPFYKWSDMREYLVSLTQL